MSQSTPASSTDAGTSSSALSSATQTQQTPGPSAVTGFDSSSFLIFFFSFVVALALTLLLFRRARIYLYRHYGYGTPPRGLGGDPLWMMGGWHGTNPAKSSVKRRRPDKFSISVKSDAAPEIAFAESQTTTTLEELSSSLPLSLELAVPSRPPPADSEDSTPDLGNAQEVLPAYLNVLVSLPTDPKLLGDINQNRESLSSDSRSLRSVGTVYGEESLGLPRYAIGSALVEIQCETTRSGSDRLEQRNARRAQSEFGNQQSIGSVMRFAKHCHDKRRRMAKHEREETNRTEAATVAINADASPDVTAGAASAPFEEPSHEPIVPQGGDNTDEPAGHNHTGSADLTSPPTRRWGRLIGR